MPQPHARSPFADSKWIWPDSHHWNLHNTYAVFRKEITLAKVPQAAPLFITADQSYQLYVNGHYVCGGPARGYQCQWPYDEVDVAPFLQPGVNLLAVRAHHPGFGNFQYISQAYAGLLVAARWGAVRVATDETWRCRRQTGVKRDTVPTSVQLFGQEHIDLRTEDPAWTERGYDDAHWSTRVAACVWNAMPWFSLEPRGLPLLEEKLVGAPVVIGQRIGRCAPGYRDADDVARLRYSEGLGHEPCRSDAREIAVPPLGKDRFVSYLLDFGRTVIGRMGFELEGAVGGEIVDTLHDEIIDARTLTPRFQPDGNSRGAPAHRLHCRAGTQTHFFYHPFGFRYVVLTIRGAPAGLRVRPQVRSAFYPLEQRGGFRCADAELQGIWDTCAWTQRVCSLDAYVDTPGREQAQWWGDARVQAKNTFFLSGDSRLLHRGIRQIAAQRTPDGLTYGHAPTIAHGCILPDFSLIWLLTLWDYYWQTESIEPFTSHQDAIADVLGYFERASDPDTGLVSYDPRYWLFLDWTELQREGTPAVLNLWLALALEKTAALHRLDGRRAQAAALDRWRRKLLAALGKLVDRNGLVGDGYDSRGRRVRETPLHAQVLGAMVNVPGLNRARAIETLALPLLRDEKVLRARPSSYWITYVFEWLREEGHGRAVVEFIRRRWLPMVAHGTTWENFEPGSNEDSYSHAWSAHPLYHLVQICGGLVQAAPGWRAIRFEPCFDALGDCEATIPSPLGPIRSAWQKKGDQIAVELELPPGVEAEVRLPKTPRVTVRENTRWTIPTKP